MAAGDNWIDCTDPKKNSSFDQVLRSMIYEDENGNPALHTNPAGTALQPYFNCDRAGLSTEMVLRSMVLEDANGVPYLNTTSS